MMTAAAALVIDTQDDVRDNAMPDAPPHAKTITFRDGLLGFPECRNFTLLRTERPGFFWLQSLEHDPLAFLLVDPFLFFEGYAVDLDSAEAAELGAVAPTDLAVFAIVTLPRVPEEPCTANLQGPIALNLRTGLGRQLILPDSDYGVRCPLDLNAA
jgi:flagellar assembly factor FliW